MDLISVESVFEVLNDNHDYFLDTTDVSVFNLNLGESPLLSSRSMEDDKFDFAEILNDNHDLYLDTSDLLSEISLKSSTKTSIKEKYTKLLNTEDHLEYLSFIQKEYETQSNAARRIQNCWRTYYHKKTFFKIKKLVLKYSNSDPAVTLRIVNPKEAALLDKASGTFIKFKLAGVKFPPKIVYKIVSRTPIIKVDTILYQCQEEKGTMTNIDRYSSVNIKTVDHQYREVNDRLNKPKKIKKEDRNDWRLYDYEAACCNKRRKCRIQTGRSKSCVRQHHLPKSLEKKLNELSWIKSQYGF